MGSFKLGKMTLRLAVQEARDRAVPRRAETGPGGAQGPCEQRRGRVHPVRHLRRSAAPPAPSRWTKQARTWAIDRFRCVQCGTCVRDCPKHCLTMDPAYTPIATAKSCRVVHVPDPKAAVTES